MSGTDPITLTDGRACGKVLYSLDIYKVYVTYITRVMEAWITWKKKFIWMKWTWRFIWIPCSGQNGNTFHFIVHCTLLIPYWSSFIVHVYMAGGCSLECTTTLLRVTEPLEDRMEQALFSPPLSKQRVDYAVQHIKESCASSLVCVLGFVLPSKLILRF